MHLILEHDLEQLKQLILNKAGIDNIHPALFKGLAAKISTATKKQVSETTLKRVFGHVANTSKPSLYTLNLLAEYCGYLNWAEFCKHGDFDSPARNVSVTEKKHFTVKAKELSQYTLVSLKNKSGIPYHLTVRRDFLDEHLDIFLNTDYPATIITAPAGYGKTVGLCHWVEEQLNNVRKTASGDVILFLSARVFNKSTFKETLYDWMFSLLGLTDGELQEHLKTNRFYFIIDSFDITALDQGQLENLFEMLLDVIAMYKSYGNFKAILSMRSSNWLNFQRVLKSANKIDEWFEGFMNESNECNVHLFSGHEMQSLIHRVKPLAAPGKKLDPEIIRLFSYPLFFQYYYQNNNKNFSLEELSVFETYDVIYDFILEKIYTGKSSTEKVFLIHLMVDRGRFFNDTFYIDKLKLVEQISQFNLTYQDLISTGVVRELNLSDNAGYIESIEFINKRIASYFIASKLIYDSEGRYDKKMAEAINTKIIPKYRLHVLKWIIYIALKNREYGVFDLVPNLEIFATEKTILIKFLTDLSKNPEPAIEENADDARPLDLTRPSLFNYFFGPELISEEYYQALENLKTMEMSEEAKIWVHIYQIIIGFVFLQEERVERNIRELRQYPSESFTAFMINPLICLEALYAFLKFGVVDRSAIREVTRFMFSSEDKRKQLNKVASNPTLYLLALNTLALADNPKKTLRFIKLLHHIHYEENDFTPEYHILLLIRKALTYLRLGQADAAIEIYKYLLSDIKDNDRKYTSYMKANVDLLSALLVDYLPESAATIRLAEDLTKENGGFKLITINTTAALLMADRLDKNDPMYKKLSFNITKLMRSTSFNPKSFIFDYKQLRETMMQDAKYNL